MDNSALSGIFIPIITPFDDCGRLACSKIIPLIERYLEIGAHGFYVGGSTGEGMLQSLEERTEYFRFVSEVVQNRAILIAQVGALVESDAHLLARKAEDYSFHVIASTPPFYFRHTEEEHVIYYQTLASVTNLPILFYNIPSMTGIDLTLQTQLELL